MGEDRASLSANGPPFETIRPQALNRAMRNLIDNAVRYGGSAKASVTQERGMAIISIADKGPELPDDRLEVVFETFDRFESSRSRDTGGVGLGLAIARTIIQAHGGSVVLRNLPEGGLEAVARLPL